MTIEKVLQELIEAGFRGTQADFQIELAKRDIDVNQSSISRALKRLSASKYGGGWVVKHAETSLGPMNFSAHIMELVRNENMIVIHTTPGSANFIAKHLDESDNKEILGTLAGDDTVLIIPRSVQNVRRATAEVVQILKYQEQGH